MSALVNRADTAAGCDVICLPLFTYFLCLFFVFFFWGGGKVRLEEVGKLNEREKGESFGVVSVVVVDVEGVVI